MMMKMMMKMMMIKVDFTLRTSVIISLISPVSDLLIGSTVNVLQLTKLGQVS